MALSIKIVMAADGGLPGWPGSGKRWGLPGVIQLVPLLGGLVTLVIYLSIVWDKKRQGFRDKFAPTYVVKG
jgi:hypothetical protein